MLDICKQILNAYDNVFQEKKEVDFMLSNLKKEDVVNIKDIKNNVLKLKKELEKFSDKNQIYIRDLIAREKGFKFVDVFHEGLAIVSREDNLKSFCDLNGDILKNEKGEEVWFGDVNEFSEGFARVERILEDGRENNFIDKNGNLLRAKWFEKHITVNDISDGLALVYSVSARERKSSPSGRYFHNFMKSDGKFLFDNFLKISSITQFHDGIAIMKENGKYKFVDKDLNDLYPDREIKEEIIDYPDDEILQGYYRITENGKTSLFNPKENKYFKSPSGFIFKDLNWGYISGFENGISVINEITEDKINGSKKYNVIDINGNALFKDFLLCDFMSIINGKIVIKYSNEYPVSDGRVFAIGPKYENILNTDGSYLFDKNKYHNVFPAGDLYIVNEGDFFNDKVKIVNSDGEELFFDYSKESIRADYSNGVFNMFVSYIDVDGRVKMEVYRMDKHGNKIFGEGVTRYKD